MIESSRHIISSSLSPNPDRPVPLYEQVVSGIRGLIKDGGLSPSTRLPSTRTLADILGVSRSTTTKAYDRLQEEGYLKSHVGSGTYVTEDLPSQYLEARPLPEESPEVLEIQNTRARSSDLTLGADRIADHELSPVENPSYQTAFRPGIPALDAFPIEKWSALVSRKWQSVPRKELVYGSPKGFFPLRKAIAKYLRSMRGVLCEAEQILIVSGVQQALSLTARVLLNDEDFAWMEDPGYVRMREVLRARGAEVRSVPVDADGFDFHTAMNRRGSSPQMACITPSHQYPLGVTMGVDRRAGLLKWAARTETWIFEDDYDSEYRFSGRPIAALQGMDNAGRVLYAGTFSKVLFPALRLGYLVLPTDLVEPFSRLRELSDRCPPRVPQMVVKDFLQEGHMEEHIRRMRTLYANRQAALVEAIEKYLGNFLDAEPRDAGLHLIGWLPPGVDDQEASRVLAELDLFAPPLSFYTHSSIDRGGLLLGYGGVPTEDIPEKVTQMASALGDRFGFNLS